MNAKPATIFGCILTLLAALLAGCRSVEPVPRTVRRPFQAKDGQPVKVIYCNDYTGHVPGSIPFIFGGTCCCTPTLELVDAYHRDGLLLEYRAATLLGVYEGLGIQTIYDHRDCNNRCKWGPHILQGGKCMVPPTPGTQHYEEIITGRFTLPSPEPADQKRRK